LVDDMARLLSVNVGLPRDIEWAAPEVQQCYDVSGDWAYLVILVADGMAHCRATVERLFLEAPNIKRYNTLFVFNVVKTGLQIPLRTL
jgi:Lrp/AsnC family leucine-responsive transcriptional regulator